ncbi:MAG: gamma carbonic anhydrase family protein [Desulfobacterales bacterium]|nr:gamma carbonic anhydrase family protein [Desulfobacteraceae bacterium]MDD3991049.1 gamma carbonic anhydrase family protein [Desulfobacteraceae bacterium]MDY0311727.1 gamma carbonic anhydrase family protein [Desulfobacterales bacterium]
MILPFNGKTPTIGAGVFIAPTAVIIGDVTIGDGSSIWYGTVLRGDMAPIRIGAQTNLQDLTMVHTDYGHPAIVGDRVSVGHRAVVHGCRVEDEALVGIGAVVLNGAVVGRGSVVAAGSVVREGQEIPPGVLVAGIPAVIKRKIEAEAAELFRLPYQHYIALANAHRDLFPSEK